MKCAALLGVLVAWLGAGAGCGGGVTQVVAGGPGDAGTADSDAAVTDYECVVRQGTNRQGFQKALFVDLNVTNAVEFSATRITVGYDYGPDHLFGTPPMTWQLSTNEASVVKTYQVSDFRYQITFCEPCSDADDSCAPCPPCQFLSNTTATVIVSYVSGARFVDVYETTGAVGGCPTGYTPQGRHLLTIDLDKCLRKFCTDIGRAGDPDC
jgi:hypothetical protein